MDDVDLIFIDNYNFQRLQITGRVHKTSLILFFPQFKEVRKRKVDPDNYHTITTKTWNF